MKRLYLSGPMSGLPLSNYPAFNAAAQQLRALGHHIENPAENPPPACGTWQGWMRLALRQISEVDGVVMLPGWSKSRGARIEINLARDLGLRVWTLDDALRLEKPWL